MEILDCNQQSSDRVAATMTAIPAGALSPNQLAMVPKRLLLEVRDLLDSELNQQLVAEINSYINPPNPKFRKKR